jgi:deoxyhypusine synthase
MVKAKIKKLSPGLRKLITFEEGKHNTLMELALQSEGTITAYTRKTLLHCNGGATRESAEWLKNHLDTGGKLVVSIAGALSSFQQGILLSELIRQRKIHAISVTGANHEESYYRYIAHSHYAYIRRYTELTPTQEQELRNAGLRRITDTFLPEDESVRIMEPKLLKLMKQAAKEGKRYFPHEYFSELFEQGLIRPDRLSDPEDCWVYAAWKYKIPIFIPGFEDSTMGNIFASYTYTGKHAKKEPLFDQSIIKSGIEYFHEAYDWYMKTSADAPIAYLQLGGGIAADFFICVVPSLKHDLGIKKVRDWAGFIEIGSSPMSYGSYSGAGGKEKITWDKLSVKSYYNIIQSDVTVAFPWIAAILLDL